jgi:hypothetical protein
MIFTYKNETFLRLKRLNITVKQKLSQSSQIPTSSNINATKASRLVSHKQSDCLLNKIPNQTPS